MRFLIIWFTVLISTPSHANEYIACVQEQLSELSFEVGAVDGVVGVKTKDAVTELSIKSPELKSLPNISSHTASIWCKRIGEKFKLTAIWPSSKNSLRLEIGENINPIQGKLIAEESQQALEFLNSSLGVSIPGTIVITASNDINELVKLTAKELRGIETRKTIKQQLNAQCKNRPQSGASYGGVIALCFGTKFRVDESWDKEAQELLRRLIVHEMSHEYQKQLIGNYRRAGGNIRNSKRGPKWLFEGTAIVFEFLHAWPDSPLKRQETWFLKQQRYSGSKLKKLALHTTRVNLNFQLNAGYAGVLLVSKNGIRAVGNYWNSTPDVGWEKAFEKAFGLTIDEFYSQFGKS